MPVGRDRVGTVDPDSPATAANGNTSFTSTFDVPVAVGQTMTTTVTRAGNTSGFSGPRLAQVP